MQKKAIFCVRIAIKQTNNENYFLQIDNSKVSLYKASPEMRMAKYKNIVKFWPNLII